MGVAGEHLRGEAAQHFPERAGCRRVVRDRRPGRLGAVLDTGAEGAGLDDQRTQAERLDLLPQRLGEPFERELAGGVVPVRRQAGQTVHGGHVDDGAPAPRPHARQDEPGEGHGPEEVDFEQPPVVALFLLFERTDEVDGGVVDEHVDGTEAGQGFPHAAAKRARSRRRGSRP
jgi:hypothetical protein